tara:strand:- start:1354 stop:1587 length:234 start_codon:yes stop_codon:yes gene_type:complete
MAGLTIREFTISTKVTNSSDSSVPNRQKASNKDADQGTSKGTYNQTATKYISTYEQEKLVQACVDRVLEMMQYQSER